MIPLLTAASLRPFEYNLLIWLSEHRTPLLDFFFLIGTLLGTSYAYMALIPLLFGIFDRRKACVYTSVILLSILITCLLKILFKVDRPDHSLVMPLYTRFADGFSFPSGHAQGSMTVFGLLALHQKKPWTVALCATAILWISFSRLYFGVHYPVDIIGGWLIGGVVLLIYYSVRRFGIRIPYIIAFASMIITAFMVPNHRIQILAATLAGIYCGMSAVMLTGKIDIKADHPAIKTFCLFIGCGLLLVAGKPFLLPSAVYFLIGVWLSFASIYIERIIYRGLYPDQTEIFLD